jgi:hypothetical protein
MKPKMTSVAGEVLKNRSGTAIPSILVVLVVAGIALYFLTSYHVVRTSGGIKLYPKESMTFKDSYVDMTSLAYADLKNHSGVVRAMTKAGDLKYVPGGKTLKMAEKAGIDTSEVVTEFEDENEVLKFLKKWGQRGKEKFEELKRRMDIPGKVEKSKRFVEDKKKKAKDFFKND